MTETKTGNVGVEYLQEKFGMSATEAGIVYGIAQQRPGSWAQYEGFVSNEVLTKMKDSNTQFVFDNNNTNTSKEVNKMKAKVNMNSEGFIRVRFAEEHIVGKVDFHHVYVDKEPERDGIKARIALVGSLMDSGDQVTVKVGVTNKGHFYPLQNSHPARFDEHVEIIKHAKRVIYKESRDEEKDKVESEDTTVNTTPNLDRIKTLLPKGVGESVAVSILRHYTSNKPESIESYSEVKGVGPATLEVLKDNEELLTK